MPETRSHVTIHTTLIPESKPAPESGKIRWRVLPHPSARKKATPKARKTTPAKRKDAQSKTPGEKLLRNAAIACSLLLTLLALSNLNQPWTERTVASVRSAVTMRIDLDESLGKLHFVRDLVPDAALVFWNMGAGDMTKPVSGQLFHPYDANQPWLLYQTGGAQPVRAALAGQVIAATQDANGAWTLMIDHESGEQTIYAYVAHAIVRIGQTVASGDQIGVTADADDARLYFELRKDGQPQDPSARLGL
jgi:murein DD-endopeptidase MepM/ murein hydrolase activator NlpD